MFTRLLCTAPPTRENRPPAYTDVPEADSAYTEPSGVGFHGVAAPFASSAAR